MSGYFIHGGTQYPFGQGGNSNQTQSRQTSASSSNVSTNYYGNNSTWQQGSQQQSSTDYPTSYPTTNSNSNKLDYTSNYSSQSYGSSNSGSGGYGSRSLGSTSAGTIGNSRNSYGQSSVSSSSYDSGYTNSYSSSQTTPASQGSNTGSVGSNYYSSSNKNYSYGGAGDATTYSGSNSYSANNNSYSSNTYESAYEKVLYNAANQYFQNNRRGGALSGGRGGGFNNRNNKRGGRGGLGRGGMNRGAGGDQRKSASQNTGPKPIKASEVKAYLYAWCGQRKLKPEYEITPKGTQPKVTFSCKLIISGLDYIAEVEASNKKDAQSKAAWDFCENLVKIGYMKTTELPPKPNAPAPKSGGGSSTNEAVGSLPAESSEEVAKHGGWTLSNSRQRLNQFCQREHLSPDFKHQTLGPEHARVFICDLKINVKSLQKEFESSERGSNKKQATAVCALSMVRQLYANSLIEKQGDPIKHVSRGSLIEGKAALHMPKKAAAMDEQNRKRKAEDQTSEPIDENGNWTLENSRQRLNQYCQVHSVPCDVIYAEEGQPGSRTYTASVNLKVKKDEEDQEITASAHGQSKKTAAQGCALQILAQLYKLTLVEPNLTGSSPITKKKNSNGRMKFYDNPFGPKRMCPPNLLRFIPQAPWSMNEGAMFASGRVPMRKTNIQDSYINEKHKQIYPTEKELDVVQKAVRVVELALKDVADAMTEPADAKAESADVTVKKEPGVNGDADTKEAGKKRKLQSVVRVGTLAKGLLLKGDTCVDLVLLCQDAPTQMLLVQVAQMLPKHLKPSTEGDKVDVQLAVQHAALVVNYSTGVDAGKMTVKVSVSLTSPVIRNPPSEGTVQPTGLLNKDKCLDALAEVRHAKWFQACANVIPSCIIIIRILREMKQRLREWKVLNDWTLELVVEKALRTSPVPLSLGGSLQRVFECISSGMLLPGQNSIMDPCERDSVDAAENLSNQERENITASAQSALRLFTFRQPHKVLGIEEMKSHKSKEGSETTASTASTTAAAAEPMQQ